MVSFEDLKKDALERLETVHESDMPLGEKRAKYKEIVDWYGRSVDREIAIREDFLEKKGPAFVRR